VTAQAAPAPALELRDITKWFGTLAALRDVTFAVRPGTLHALLGENGAGKSTLMHIAYGLLRPELGAIRVNGHSARFRSPRDARAAGIGMVHQHPTSIAAMTVAENVELAMGRQQAAGRLGDSAAWVRELSEALGLPLDPLARVESLSIAMKQRLEIVKAIAGGTRLLLLDEPTAVLAPIEASELMSVVRAYVAHGNSAVLITHKLTEALANAEEVTVLRRGIVTHQSRADATNAAELAGAMIGAAGNLGRSGDAGQRDLGEPLIVARQLVLRGGGRGHHRGRHGAIELEVRAGEIVGIAAVEGNGQRDLLRTIAGVIPPWSGQLDVLHPVAFIPEDRTSEGLVADLTLTENVVLGDAPGAGWRVDWSAAERRTAELLRVYQVRARGPGARVRSLSGGNQQRLVLARALSLEPRVIIAENPTRGLDVAAAAAVHRRLEEVAEGGGAVLFHSTDLDEVLERSDRVLVMRQGELHPAPPGADREGVGRLMLGAE
jgi:simple sugar transport system ATP-binding protein